MRARHLNLAATPEWLRIFHSLSMSLPAWSYRVPNIWRSVKVMGGIVALAEPSARLNAVRFRHMLPAAPSLPNELPRRNQPEPACHIASSNATRTARGEPGVMLVLLCALR